jgi:ADP-ribose pyrophosphatase YjhB (NUDIX family)
MDMHFCRRCGTPLQHIRDHIYTCEQSHAIYANSAPTMGVFLLDEHNDVILAVRGIEPHKDMLDSLGGFLDSEETFEAAAVRELREELALEPEEYGPLTYLNSAIGHYPFKNETLTTVCVFFWAKLLTKRDLTPADDVAAIQTIPIHEVDLSKLHDDDIRAGIRALRLCFPDSGLSSKEGDKRV